MILCKDLVLNSDYQAACSRLRVISSSEFEIELDCCFMVASSFAIVAGMECIIHFVAMHLCPRIVCRRGEGFLDIGYCFISLIICF